MRNVYLCQPNYGTGSGEFSTSWIPYSAGALWAYARADAEVARHFRLAGLLYERTPIGDVLDALDEPAVVGFSTYVWNARYCHALARAAKERWPSTFVVFGGPEVPDRDEGFLREHPYIDVAVHQEGEKTFARLLRNLAGGDPDLGSVPGVSFLDARGELVKNPSAGRIESLDELPSPYTTGVFDEMMRARPGAKWAATYETNRGCPFKCHFCDWGSLIFSKVKRFPLERVRADLEWLADHRVEYVFVADANFGVFKERDDRIADHILEVVRERGYPKTFCVQWTKNSNEEIVRMARKLSGVQKGLTLSVQSMTEKVLTAIERRNMAVNNLSEILAICNREGIPSYTELILGLPEETLESWKECFHRLLDLGQHCAIDVWIAQVLRNSALNDPAEVERYGLETIPAQDYFFGARSAGQSEAAIPEVIPLVRATRAMPFEDLVEAYLYAWMIMNFHLYGWTQLSARFLVATGAASYRDFYAALFDFVRSDATRIVRAEHDRTRERIVEYLTRGVIGGNLRDEIGLDLEIAGHNLPWLSQMVFRYHGEEVFEELRPFLAERGRALGPSLQRDLLRAQRSALVLYGERYPRTFEARSNLIDVVFEGASLTNEGPYRYRVDYHPEVRESVPHVESLSMEDFLYMLYFRRRMSPGTTSMRAIGTAAGAVALTEPRAEAADR